MEAVLAEFGKEPDTTNLSKYFDNIRVKTEAKEIFEGARKGWRMNDYYKVRMLLESEEEVAVSFDGDMFICSDNFYEIDQLTKRFGLCLPVNPRYTVELDARIGADGDVCKSYAHAVNMSPIAFHTKNDKARKLLERYCQFMEENPRRGTLVMWRAIWATGFMPCLLPPQWCVCREHIGIGDEIILHVGHDEVKEHYLYSNDGSNWELRTS